MFPGFLIDQPLFLFAGFVYVALVRKPIVIGAIPAVLIGVAAFWCSNYVGHRENSIEYHKAEYLAARDGRPIMNDMRGLWGRVTGQRHRHRISGEKLRLHGEALIRLGYWREETIVVSNRSAADVWETALQKGRRRPLTKEICVVSVTTSNKVVVRAVPDHIPIWVGLIQDADVPENGEPK